MPLLQKDFNTKKVFFSFSQFCCTNRSYSLVPIFLSEAKHNLDNFFNWMQWYYRLNTSKLMSWFNPPNNWTFQSGPGVENFTICVILQLEHVLQQSARIVYHLYFIGCKCIVKSQLPTIYIRLGLAINHTNIQSKWISLGVIIQSSTCAPDSSYIADTKYCHGNNWDYK